MEDETKQMKISEDAWVQVPEIYSSGSEVGEIPCL